MSSENTPKSGSANVLVMRRRESCKRCGGIGQVMKCRCIHCGGVGYMGYREVSKDQFYTMIGKVNCHPSPVGQYPYTSQFRTWDGVVVGAHVGLSETYWLQEE